MASWDLIKDGILGARSLSPSFLMNFAQQFDDRLMQAEDRMNPERLGQLQHYIGSAREKQERWKSRVQGGNLFKKNQVALPVDS
jgi:hypothetical protein